MIQQEASEEKNKRSKKSNYEFIEPGILLLLKESPSHGYGLLDKLATLDIITDQIEGGTVYRTLRGMEKEGFIKSKWVTKESGAAKKVYEITPKALEAANHWADIVERDIGVLEGLLQRLKQVVSS